LWRVNLIALLCAFAIGFTIYAYVRVRFWMVVVGVILVALLIVVPPLVNATVPPVSSILAAGNVDVASGTVTETPQINLAFIGRAGDYVTIGVAEEGSGDESLSATSGFTDRASAGLVNAARNRAETEVEIEQLQARLSSDLLTESQRATLTDELSSLTVPSPVTETYALNSLPVNVQVLDAETLDVIGDGQVEVGSPPLVLQLPEDGWYILRKTIAGEDESVVLLQATGIYALIERNLTDGDEYVRVTDDFTITDSRPEIDGDNVPMIVLTDNQYQGQRSFGDYARLSLAPFLELMGRALVPMFGLVVVGYAAGWGVGRIAPLSRRAHDARGAARSVLPILWIVFLVWMFILLYGVTRLDAAGLGNLLARFVWVGWMFFAGMNLHRVWGRPLLALVVVLGVVQTAVAEGFRFDDFGSIFRDFSEESSDIGPRGSLGWILALIVALVFKNPAARPLVIVGIWLFVGIFAARQGVRWRDKYSSRNAVLGVVLSGGLWLILFILPTVLVGAAVSAETMRESTAENLLPTVDTRRWGGFLLTMVLTVVSIIASFPIGVALALGRRSSLPLVKWVCTVYIELVRGVPFITVLFLGMLLVPLVDPSLSNVDNAIRAMVGTTMFSAAYLAENVRGGLQSVPPGQEEAARALGLSNFQVTMLITLPQALRAVIPALVGQAIALFKDTSLVALVGLTDLFGVSKSVTAQAEYVGLWSESYIFISIIYFVFSYVMAYISRRIEASGSGAARRI
jgi:His/Glu/Gln/Arg/opine family amino acid ABC transporter permease subunit